MRITTLGPAARLGGAILPVPARDARAYQTWGTVFGAPGTVPIPAPLPAGTPQFYAFTALHRSSDAPPWWRPAIYFQRLVNATRPNVSVYSDNQMPVPARTGSGRPAVMLRRPTFLRQRQVGAVNGIPTFPWIR